MWGRDVDIALKTLCEQVDGKASRRETIRLDGEVRGLDRNQEQLMAENHRLHEELARVKKWVFAIAQKNGIQVIW